MTVLNRRDLEQSPLADLHALAADLGVEGFRRMRRAELIGALARDDGGGGKVSSENEGVDGAAGPAAETPATATAERARAGDEVRSGEIEVLGNGSAFIRAKPGTKSSDDVYVSPAQVRRCELRSGDAVAGPVRRPRRSERYPSLVRVETVNGVDADRRSERTRLDQLTAAFPAQRLSAPEGLEQAPFGRGSRVIVAGPPGAGATTLLRSIARTFVADHPDLALTVVLIGVRPEEVGEWRAELPDVEIVGGSFDQPIAKQAEAARAAADGATRVAEGGGDAALVVDALDALDEPAARRLLAAGRNSEEAGSVTVVASWSEPHALRLATTRIVLSAGGRGQLDVERSGALRAELLS
jgi:transcription termination factor Rho